MLDLSCQKNEEGFHTAKGSLLHRDGIIEKYLLPDVDVRCTEVHSEVSHGWDM